MGRGLDGFFISLAALCGFQAPPGPVSQGFRWHIARGKHLFPFRTEPLSPSAPMVLGGQPPGRVGRRRSFIQEPPSGGSFSFRLRRVAVDRGAEVRTRWTRAWEAPLAMVAGRRPDGGIV